MMHSYDLKFRGLRAPVRLEGIADPESLLKPYFQKWPFSLSEATSDNPFICITREGEMLRMTSAFYEKPRSHKTEVNAVCDMIAVAAKSRADEQDQEMCLHAAAVRIDGKLVVFPALRRAGKSVLTEALAARGCEVFGDDVLSVSAVVGQPYLGMAGGAPLRLRLPLPEAIPAQVAAHAARHAGPTNGQYLYVTPPEIAPHGTMAPIGAFVALERDEGKVGRIAPMSRGVMLSRLLVQNFARTGDAGFILSTLFGLASSVPSFSLTYSDIDAACDLLVERLAGLPDPMPITETPPRSEAGSAPLEIAQEVALVRHPDADTHELDGEIFATNHDLTRVLHLNRGALMIWTLLEQPTTEEEAVTILKAGFPDVAPEQVASDVARAFSQFREAGLVAEARG